MLGPESGYRPAFPDRFGSIQDARAHGQEFFAWSRHVGDSITHMISDSCVVISDHPHKYNEDHPHSGLGLLTPHRGEHVGAQGQAVRGQAEVHVVGREQPADRAADGAHPAV